MGACLIKDGKVANSHKLEGLSKAQCQDHIPKSHTLHDHLISTGSLNMGGFRLINLADPTDDQDMATKAYVDSLLKPTPPDPPLIAWPYNFPSKCSIATIQSILKSFRDLGIYQIMEYSHWWDNGYTTDPAYVAWWFTLLDQIEAYGMKIWILIDNRTRIGALSVDDEVPFITKYKGKAAIAGWLIADEPNCWCTWEGYTMPEADKQYYPYLSTFSWPAGGHSLATMLYDLIRGQDNDPGARPAISVWLYGFEKHCGDYWHSIYNHIYTPGDEPIFDIGSVDIYPYKLWGEDCLDTLDHWINYSYQFPNGDGFGELGYGMIPVIQAFVNANEVMPDCIPQYDHWKAKYDKANEIKAVGLWKPHMEGTGFLDDTPVGEALRIKIKALATYLGWTGS